MGKIVSEGSRARPSLRLPAPLAGSLAAVLGYISLVCVFAWPLPLHLMDRVVLARGSDFYPHVWNLWWMRFSLLTLHQQPYHTTYLQYPTGMPLLYHVLDPLNGLVSLPLQATLGLVPAFNLLRLAHLIFAASAACALCRLLRLPWAAAWAGGALFAVCPLIGTSMDLGQLVELSVGWLPLYILLLIKGLGNRALGIRADKIGWLVGAGLALAASALSTWYFFTSLVLFTLLYVAWEIGAYLLSVKQTAGSAEKDEAGPHASVAERRGWQPLLPIYRAAIVGGVALLLLSPLIIALLRESASGATYMVTPLSTIVLNSADLFSLFLPLPAHIKNAAINPHGSNPAVGWTVLVLAVAGLLFARSVRSGLGAHKLTDTGGPLRFWLVVAVVFAVLALGPQLVVGGQETGIPLPYKLLNSLPFLGAARVPLRFVLMVSLALSVLAAYGLWGLSRWVRSPIARAGLFMALALLISIEFFGIPRVMITPTVHPFIASLRADGGEGAHNAILELPYAERVAAAMFDQSAHQRPMLGGYTARHYPYPWILTTPGVAQLTQFDEADFDGADIIEPGTTDTALAALDYYGVRYVAAYTRPGEPENDKIAAVIDDIFTKRNIAPVYKDPALTAYRVPAQTLTRPLVWLGEGWYKSERRDDLIWRWTDGNAHVQIINPAETSRTTRLRLAPYAVTTPRTLLVLRDGEEITRRLIGPYPGESLTLMLSLSPGEHSVELRSLEPPERVPGDPRELSLGFQQVAVDFP